MDQEKQGIMIENAQTRMRVHEREVRKYRICSGLCRLGLAEEGATEWYDEKEHDKKKMATRITRIKTEQGQKFMIQVGVAATDSKVGESPEGTFVYSFAEISFASDDPIGLKTAVIREMTHHDNGMTRGAELDIDSPRFEAVEFTVDRARMLTEEGVLKITKS